VQVLNTIAAYTQGLGLRLGQRYKQQANGKDIFYHRNMVVFGVNHAACLSRCSSVTTKIYKVVRKVWLACPFYKKTFTNIIGIGTLLEYCNVWAAPFARRVNILITFMEI
jgi:hypothetical protein